MIKFKKLLVLFIILNFLIACSNQKNTATTLTSNIGHSEQENEWLNQTYSFFTESFLVDGQKGGYFDYLKYDLQQKQINTDVSSSLWYLQSLQLLGSDINYSTESLAEIENVLHESWNDNKEDLYINWIIFSLYKKLNIEPSDNMKNSLENMLNNKLNEVGFYLDENGNEDFVMTSISVQLINLLEGYEQKLDQTVLINKITEEIKKKDTLNLMTLVLIYIDSNESYSSKLIKQIEVYLNENWNSDDYSLLDYIYNYFYISKNLGIKINFPKKTKKDLESYLLSNLNTNFVDGAIVYQCVYILSDDLDKEFIKNYIEKNKNSIGLWNGSMYKTIDLQETYYGLSLYKLLGLSFDEKKKEYVLNLYNYYLDTDFNLQYTPYLMGISFWLQEQGIKHRELDLNLKELKKLNIVQKSDVYFDLLQIYSLYNKPFDENARKLQYIVSEEGDVALRDDSKNQFSLKTRLAVLIAKHTEETIGVEEINQILLNYSVSEGGYTMTPESQIPDLKHSYLFIFAKKAIGLPISKSELNFVNKFKGEKGYSLYRENNKWYNMEFTFYGFFLSKLKSEVN